MPTSALVMADPTVTLIAKTKPRTVLDVGPGYGKYGPIIREYCHPTPQVDAVEAWPAYVEKHGLRGIYRNLYEADVMTLDPEILAQYDTVFMGDVIEHLAKDDALKLIARIPGHIVINTPEHFFHNGDNLPWTETHRSHWEYQDFLGTGRLEFYTVMHAGQLVHLGKR